MPTTPTRNELTGLVQDKVSGRSGSQPGPTPASAAREALRRVGSGDPELFALAWVIEIVRGRFEVAGPWPGGEADLPPELGVHAVSAVALARDLWNEAVGEYASQRAAWTNYAS